MNISSSIALSGLGAAQARLQVSGHNIANTETQGFQPQQVLQADVAGNGGVTTRLGTAQSGGLESDMVYRMQGQGGFAASLAVVKAQDAALGSLLDVKA